MPGKQRLSRVEAGLRQLDGIDAPLVVGDFPDAWKADGILSRGQLPERSILAQRNQRLKAWAAMRRNVISFPLASLMVFVNANEELTLANHTRKKGKSGARLRGDHLHPSPHGLAALAIAVLAPRYPATAPTGYPESVYAAGITPDPETAGSSTE